MNIIKNSQIGKNFIIGMTGSVFIALAGIVRTALLVKTLSIEEYGYILITINFFSVLAIFVNIRVNDLLYRFFPKYKNSNDKCSLSILLLMSLLASLFIGVIIGGIAILFANNISMLFYGNNNFTNLIKIYSFAAIFSSFDGFSTAILRIFNCYSQIVLSQITGAFFSLSMLSIYFIFSGNHKLEIVVILICLGSMASSIPQLYFAIKKTKNYLYHIKSADKNIANLIKQIWLSIKSTLVQTNIVSILKLGSETGGIFFLGVLAGPRDVALYGVARQLTIPFSMIQNNVQAALTPEITRLAVENKLRGLISLIHKITIILFIIIGMLCFGFYLLGPTLIEIITTDEYKDSIVIININLIIYFLAITTLSFYPVTLALDELSNRNKIYSLGFVYLAIVIGTYFNATTLAIAQLLSIMTVIIFNDVKVYLKLRDLQTKP